MIVSLDIVYRSQFHFLPMRSPDGHFLGVELITNFVGVDTPVRIPTELVTPNITTEQQLALLNEKLSLLEFHRIFLKSQHLLVWLNINENIVDAILKSPQLIIRIKQLPFIEFTINEHFENLNQGSDNRRLREISRIFPLALADFGVGIATTKSIFDGLFTSIMLDKAFIHKQIHEDSFEPFMMAILGQLSPMCRALVIAGIDNEKALEKVQSLGFNAMQGNLWPAVPSGSLQTLKPHAQLMQS